MNVIYLLYTVCILSFNPLACFIYPCIVSLCSALWEYKGGFEL